MKRRNAQRLVLAAVGALCLAAFFAADRYYRQQVHNENYQQLSATLAATKQKIEDGMRVRIQMVEDLAAFITAVPYVPERDEFRHFAGLLLSHSPSTRALQYVNPEHVIEYIVPLEGNEPALGLNLMSRPAEPFVKKAIRTGETTVNDPTVTVQGSLSIVARSPAYDGDRYLGLAQGVFDISTFLEDLQGTLDSPFAVRLKDGTGKTFWQNVTLSKEQVSSTVRIGDNLWFLTVGWDQAEPRPAGYIIALIWGLGGAFLLSLLVALNQMFRHVTELSAAVERKTADLAESEARYRTLIETADDAITQTDLEGRLLFANDAYYTTLGIDRNSDSTETSWEGVHPDDEPELREAHAQLLESGTVSTEYRVRHADGHWMHRFARANLIRDENGEPQSILSIIRDITEKKRLEEERRKLEKQVFQAQKMEAVGQLTAGVAHDFNNLLMAMNGNAELIMMRLNREDPLRNTADAILKAGSRAADLISKLLAFSRKQMVNARPVDLNAVVSRSNEMLGRIIGEHIDVRLELSPDLWQTNVDATQIEQVIINLAVNARDAMPDGGTLLLETGNVAVEEPPADDQAGLQPGEYVRLRVQDSGHGMSPEVQSHLFEPFFTTKPPGKGTGLGLAAAYGIVTQSEGHISVSSREGAGSTFTVYLPRSTEEREEPGPSRPQRAAGAARSVHGGHETILLVEDDGDVRAMSRDVLTEHGYTVLEATSGEQALELAGSRSGPIHLVLTDVVMPGMSGTALADELAARFSEIKVLFMSGYPDELISDRGELHPQSVFLSKPFSLPELIGKVRGLLE